MFAEELGGNTNRRKQEEARARRRQLKQQQQKKAQQESLRQQQQQQKSAPASLEPGTTSPATAAAAAPSAATADSDVLKTVAAKTGTTPSTAADVSAAGGNATKPSSTKPASEAQNDSDTTKSSAAANALQQRQLRQQARNEQRAAMTIQSFVRAHRSNLKLMKQQSNIVAQRLKDISTLRVVLKQQGKGDYVPPPALATSLVQQILFLTKTLPYRRRSVPDVAPEHQQKEQSSVHPLPIVKIRDILNDPMKLHLLLQVVILPGLNSTDENMNPFLTWMQTQQGTYRLESLLRLCLVVATMPNADAEVVRSITKFLRGTLLLGDSNKNNNIRASIVEKCRPMLLAKSSIARSQNTPPTSVAERKNQCQQHAESSVPMDIIQILRYHLLYSTGGPDPIPREADRCREACIPPKHREQADLLFQLVFDVIQHPLNGRERQIHYLRFVSEILTIPLLTWKTSVSSTSKLLEPAGPQTVDSAACSSKQQPIILIAMIQNFVKSHGPTLSGGGIGSLLEGDTHLTACPATPTQSLLANLILLGRSTPILNGSDAQKLDFQSTTRFFHFVATLVDTVPLGTFSSRESVVEWISDGKGHHSPVVLSSVVIEQCKMLLVDAFVRKLLHCAINVELLRTEDVLKHKNDKDLKQENELQDAGRASAASLAAQEARIDRNKGFWGGSGWARKLSKNVSKMLAGDGGKPDTFPGSTPSKSAKSSGNLMNTSSVSRTLAAGGKSSRDSSHDEELLAHVPKESYSPELLIALCRVYGIVLARWGGGGRDDIVKRVKDSTPRRDENGANQDVATSKADLCTQALLNVLCFSTSILRALWGVIQSDPAVVSDVYAVIDPTKGNVPVRSLHILPTYSSDPVKPHNRMKNDGAALLYVFVCTLAHVLIITDDSEIHDMEKPLPLHQLRRCIQTLKQLLYRSCCIDDAMISETAVPGDKTPKSTYFGLALISSTSRTMRDLYDRSSRRPFSVPKLWLVEDLMEKEIRRCKTHDQYVALLNAPALRVCPFLVSFKRRLRIFERIVTTNRVDIQGENSPNPFHTNPLKPGIPVRITRGRILEDGLSTMNNLGRNMRQRIAVQYHNEAGVREVGVDAGGLFKEFWTDLCAIAFDPNYALFRVTEGSGNCMYPSPSSGAAHGRDHITLFEFLGRILGKALFEGITIRPQFAHFFLSFLRGDYNYFHMLPDLSTMDPQLHNNLMFLKTYDGDAEDLCLTFTVANDDFGGNTEIPLIPNGADIPVTDLNKQRYIGLVAKHHVVDRVKEQSEAFTRGLWEVIDRQWLLLFNEPELQVLISGATDGKIDVDDMRQNTRYAGGYTGIDRNISRFWKVVGTLSSKHQADLLRFVTSCERPPPLGFASLIPPFTIQRVGILRDGDKLPTSSTCFNTLKLPTYSSEKVLRERLIYAIEAGAGFELT